MKTDLHFHSYYSDGIYPPRELVEKLKEKNIREVSLTDHNTIDGVEEFLVHARKVGLKAVTGVEIYTSYKGKSLHILGHGFDLKNKELNNTLKELQAKKKENVVRAVGILREKGWKIGEEELFALPTRYYGPYHLASLLRKNDEEKIREDFQVEKGEIILINDIIKRYFLESGEKILPEVRIPTEEAIKLISRSGGKAVLAHPGDDLSWPESDLVKDLKKAGLSGLEAVSSHHNWSGMVFWQKIAKENNLEITIGSDFHGDVPLEWGFKVRSQWEC